MSLTVLIVAGGGFQGESLAEAIRGVPDARVIVMDSVPDNLGRSFADHVVVSPPLGDIDRFARHLEDVIRAERVTLVLPCSNLPIRALSMLRQRIEQAGARLGIADGALLDILLDKQRTYEALIQAGISAQLPIELSAGAELPLCGKPRDGWGGRDIIVLRTPEQLGALDIAAHARSHCWVPWVPFLEEYSADFAIDFAGQISPLTLRHRVRTSGGFAVISDSVSSDALHGVVEDTARWLASQGGAGLFNVQVLGLEDGTLFVSDVNPRHGTSGGHAGAEGNHLVAFLCGKPQASTLRHVRTIRSLRRVVVPIQRASPWKGVVFDLDDTLIDHKRWVMDKFALVASDFSSRVSREHFLSEAYAVVEEGHYDRLIDVLAERLAMNDAHAELLAAYRAALPARARLFPEVPDVLRSLRAAGLRIGLLTDNPPASQQAKLDSIKDVANLFDAIVFSREHGREKPHVNGFLTVAAKLGLPPHALLMVGDNVSRDAVGAVAAGYDACLLVCRAGGRFQFSPELLKDYHPEVWTRSWSASDLRTLTTACSLSSRQ